MKNGLIALISMSDKLFTLIAVVSEISLRPLRHLAYLISQISSTKARIWVGFGTSSDALKRGGGVLLNICVYTM